MLSSKLILGKPDAKRRFALFGIPYDASSSLTRPGARFAPGRIRDAIQQNLLFRIQDNAFYDVEGERLIRLDGYALDDYGDIFVSGHDHMATYERARQYMAEILASGAFPIVLGGDHSASIPLMKAFHDHSDGPLGIIHMDAHLDLMDESPRQGRYSGSSPMRRALNLERFQPKNLVQVGVRGFNYPNQYEYITSQGIHHITASKLNAMGAKSAAEQALELAGAGGVRVYLSLDADVMDHAFAPGIGMEEAGGLTSALVLQFVRIVAPHIAAMDIVEVNPLMDKVDVTSNIAAHTIFTVIAARIAAG